MLTIIISIDYLPMVRTSVKPNIILSVQENEQKYSKKDVVIFMEGVRVWKLKSKDAVKLAWVILQWYVKCVVDIRMADTNGAGTTSLPVIISYFLIPPDDEADMMTDPSAENLKDRISESEWSLAEKVCTSMPVVVSQVRIVL
jgi:hypothetical protein